MPRSYIEKSNVFVFYKSSVYLCLALANVVESNCYRHVMDKLELALICKVRVKYVLYIFFRNQSE